jgi:RNA polymerase subunit RPABC4/transcription elongation factor Spt4
MLAVFGIESDGLNLAVNLLLLFLAVVYFALVYWTYADARRRIADPMLIGCATAAAILFPFVGAFVYMIVRPPEYLDDVRERELEIQASEARMHALDYQLCPHCDFEVKSDFRRCPNCMRKLKDPCHNCARPLDPAWKLCPYCEADIPGVTPAPRRARRQRSQETAAFEAPPQ